MSESKPRADEPFDPDEPSQPAEPVEIPLGSETGTAAVEADAPESLGDVFARWFLRFNTHDPEAHPKGKPTPGSVSWMRAGEIIAEAGLGAKAVEVLGRITCWTRHMHTGAMALDAGWLESGQYEIDTERFRARPHRMTDAPQNWFAVETSEVQLRDVLAWLLDNDQGGDDVVGSPLAGPLSVEELRHQIGHVPPRSAQEYKDDADTMTPAGENRAPPGGLGPIGEFAWRKGAELAMAADARPAETREPEPPSDANCPPGYQLLVTPEGHYVAAWYSPPRRSEAEVVADAWKHHTQGK